MDWTPWLSLSPAAFERRLRRQLAKPIMRRDFIALYNALITLASEEPDRIAAIADRTAGLLAKRKRTREALDMLELAARAHFLGRKPDQGFERIKSMISLDAEAARDAALELAEDVVSDTDRFGTSVDQRPRILAAASDIFRTYGEYERVAEIHLEAALLYSRHGAYQAAYRSLRDVEGIARRIRSPELLARLHKAGLAISFEQGDRDWAVWSGRRAKRIYSLLGKPAPVDLLSNLGIAYLNAGSPEKAAESFREAMRRAPVAAGLRAALQTNLASALRRMKRFDEARSALELAEAELMEDDWPEHRLEFELSHARLAADTKDAAALHSRVQQVASALDTMLAKVLRLHHRRGIRERYLNHIESLMSRLPAEGDAADLLAPIAAVRGNALGDWLAIIAWTDAIILDDRFDGGLKGELRSTIRALRSFGAPHLYGYREKYDDAWSSFNRGAIWDRLSNIAARIVAAGGPSPLSSASLAAAVDLCAASLRDGHSLMTTTYTPDAAWLWLLVGDRYWRSRVDLKVLIGWKIALYQYASGQMDKMSFAGALQVFANEYGIALNPLLDKVAERCSSSIRYLPDFHDPPPLMGLALDHPILSPRMADGTFEIRISPALQGPIRTTEGPIRKLAAMYDPKETLLLPRFEGPGMAAAAEAELSLLSIDGVPDLAEALGDTDALLVSTHGGSLAFFTDAYFARMGTREDWHPISVEALQLVAPDLPLRLVLLNSCHSATGSGRNLQHGFRTSDVVTLPGLFLANRLAVAGGMGWPISDTAGYLYAVLTGQALADGHAPSKALTVAAARLRGISTSDAKNLLGLIKDRAVRAKSIERVTNAPEHGAFSHRYVSGGFFIYGLL